MAYPNGHAEDGNVRKAPPSASLELETGSPNGGSQRLLANCPDLLTVQDLSGLTGLSEQTIRAEINNGDLPGFRIGRRLFVPKARLLEYIEREVV